jgi:hypothetical protein
MKGDSSYYRKHRIQTRAHAGYMITLPGDPDVVGTADTFDQAIGMIDERLNRPASVPCSRCGAHNQIVNLCRCDPADLPTHPATA